MRLQSRVRVNLLRQRAPHATGYALAGTLSRERLLVLAEAIYKQGADKR